MTETAASEALLPLARARVYAYLAACFRYPDAASWEQLAGHQNRSTFAYACALLAEEEPYRAMRRHCGGLPIKMAGNLGEVQEHFLEVFGHTISKQCPPYETEYGTAHMFQQSDFLADLAGFYRAFGVEAKERVERLDHISTELEFLYLVAFKEAHALRSGLAEGAQICRDAQAAFLEDHLGRWAPVFARRLERKDPDGPYGAAARMLLAFIAAEAKALAAESDPAPDLARGEILPLAADEWDSSEWRPAGGPTSSRFEGETPCS